MTEYRIDYKETKRELNAPVLEPRADINDEPANGMHLYLSHEGEILPIIFDAPGPGAALGVFSDLIRAVPVSESWRDNLWRIEWIGKQSLYNILYDPDGGEDDEMIDTGEVTFRREPEATAAEIKRKFMFKVRVSKK